MAPSSNGDGDGVDGARTDGGSPPGGTGRPARPSNFAAYLELKNRGRSNDEHRAANNPRPDNAEQGGGERPWNHLTGPLLREPPSSKKDDGVPSRLKHPTPSIFSDLERSQTVDRFVNIFTERMGDAMSSGKLSRAWQGDGGGGSDGTSIFSWLLADHSPEASQTRQSSSLGGINPNDYAAERKLMTPHLTPVIWGSACTVITLFSLRAGKWYQARYAGNAITGSAGRSSYSGSSIGSRGRAATTNSASSLQDVRLSRPYNAASSPFDPQKEAKKKLMTSMSTLPVDIALSILFGISTTVFLTRPKDLMNDFAKAPLLEGESVLAEELCEPFAEEMKSLNEMVHTYTPYSVKDSDGVSVQQRQVVPYSELWREENLGEFDSLRAVRDFVANCHERKRYKKR